MDCSLPGSSVHGILQARVLEWVAISFSWWSSWSKDQTLVSHIAGRRFNLWATREALNQLKKQGVKVGNLCMAWRRCDTAHLGKASLQVRRTELRFMACPHRRFLLKNLPALSPGKSNLGCIPLLFQQMQKFLKKCKKETNSLRSYGHFQCLTWIGTCVYIA